MGTNRAAAAGTGARQEAGAPAGLPPCPWCGAATGLEVRGDGFGQMAVACGTCGAAGPQVKLAGDLSAADQRAAALWAGRRPQGRAVARDTVNRVGMAVRMHCLTGRLTPEATIGVAWSDLDVLLRSVAVAEAPAAGAGSGGAGA